MALLAMGLAAGSMTACGDHGRCVVSGMPECSSMNQLGCQQTPQCRWEKVCVVFTSCYGASEAVCQTLDYCAFRSGSCTPTSDPCEQLSVENCGSDKRCGLTMACRGTPVSCDSYDDVDACEADMHCDWYRTPSF